MCGADQNLFGVSSSSPPQITYREHRLSPGENNQYLFPHGTPPPQRLGVSFSDYAIICRALPMGRQGLHRHLTPLKLWFSSLSSHNISPTGKPPAKLPLQIHIGHHNTKLWLTLSHGPTPPIQWGNSCGATFAALGPPQTQLKMIAAFLSGTNLTALLAQLPPEDHIRLYPRTAAAALRIHDSGGWQLWIAL